MDIFQTTSAWREAYPGALAGVLAIENVANPKSHPALEKRKRELEAHLRATYTGKTRQDLRKLAQFQAYDRFYKQFKKTYHLLLQLESVAFKMKSIPRVAALVEAMFMAELNNLLLTAGHDLDTVQPPVILDVAKGHETYIRLNGKSAQLKTGDMFIADRLGVISSILYGPDQRTCFTPTTQRALYTVYGPLGISPSEMHAHLSELETFVRLITPQAQSTYFEVFHASTISGVIQ